MKRLSGVPLVFKHEWEDIFQRLQRDDPLTDNGRLILSRLLIELFEKDLIQVLDPSEGGPLALFQLSKEFEIRWKAAHAVHQLVVAGVSPTEAVKTVEVELDNSATPLGERTIWKAYAEMKDAQKSEWTSPFPDITE